MLTTPLLVALSEAFPAARFDWAVSDWASPAVSTNPRLTRTLSTGRGAGADSEQLKSLLDAFRAEAYDTCFIPGPPDATLVRLAREAGIPQRVGLNGGRHAGLRRGDYTLAVNPPPGERHAARLYLALARAVGVDAALADAAEMEFAPPDRDRTAAARWLVEELDWLGDRPLVMLHPGGGENPAQRALDKRWPAERFARLGNYLTRTFDARVVVVGLAEERGLAVQLTGMMAPGSAGKAANRAGEIGLGELGALCELADLYVGNDCGASLIAAATGCPTLLLYGPTDPALTAPRRAAGRVTALWRPYEGPFSWANGVTVDEATAAAAALLQSSRSL